MINKIALFCAGVICSTFVEAQSLTNIKQDNISAVGSEEEFFSLLDMKIFHDPQIVKEMMLSLYEQNQSSEFFPRGLLGAFNEKDAAILEDSLNSKKVTYNVTPELIEKADKDPFGAFKTLIKEANLPKMTDEELTRLNQVDKKAISNMMQMATEAGPDIGAKTVSVMYNK